MKHEAAASDMQTERQAKHCIVSYLDVCGTRHGHVEKRTQPEGDRSLIAVKQTGYGAQNIWTEETI